MDAIFHFRRRLLFLPLPPDPNNMRMWPQITSLLNDQLIDLPLEQPLLRASKPTEPEEAEQRQQRQYQSGANQGQTLTKQQALAFCSSSIKMNSFYSQPCHQKKNKENEIFP